MNEILLGFTVPEGKPFYIPKGHIVVTGITQHGKSTTLEAIFKRDPIAKAIVFLTKRGEKTFPDARRIPPYYKERWDWEYMRGLLEAAMHERLKFETPWIIRISKFSHSIADFRKGLAMELSKPSVREFDKNIYMLLAAYLDKVLPVLDQARSQLVTYVDLKPGINVVDLTDWYTQEAFQMLIIRAFMEYILEKENNVKIGLLEAWKMLPQNRNTPVKLFFEKFIREGATNDNYLVLDAQDLGGIDKTPLRQVSVWIMGKMMEANEVERLLSQTLGLKVPASDIQTLPLGHFIVATGKIVQKVYAWPDGSPEEMARAVAMGKEKPETVKDWLIEKRKESLGGDEDLMYKPLYEEEKRKREEGEKEFARQLEFLSDKKAEEKTKDLEKKVAFLMEKSEHWEKEYNRLSEDTKVFAEFQSIMRRMFPQPQSVMTPTETIPSMPGISIAEVDERINQRISSGPSPTPVVSVDVDQRIKELVKNSVVSRLVAKIQSLPDPAKKAAWWIHEKKQVNIKEVYNYVYDKSEVGGRIPGAFYMNVINPLVDAWLIVNENGNIRWSLQEKLSSELKDVLSNSGLEKMPKYLTSLLL